MSLVFALCAPLGSQRLSTAANLSVRPTVPPPLLCPCRHLSNTFDSVAAAGAYLSWLPGGILISVQPQFSHTLSLLCPAHSFACPFAWHLAARSLVKMLPAFHKNCFSVVLATTLTRAASLIILYEFFITAAAIEILTFFQLLPLFKAGGIIS